FRRRRSSMRYPRMIVITTTVLSAALSPAYANPHGAVPHAVKPTTSGKPTVTATSPSSATHVSGKPASTASQRSGGTKTPTTTSTRSGQPLNPIAAKIASKPHLDAKITAMLPMKADGTRLSLDDASKGFKNQGQFIAALHVSHNLGI